VIVANRAISVSTDGWSQRYAAAATRAAAAPASAGIAPSVKISTFTVTPAQISATERTKATPEARPSRDDRPLSAIPIRKKMTAGTAAPATRIHSRVGETASLLSLPIRTAPAARTNAPPRYENASTIDTGGPKNDEATLARDGLGASGSEA
jgi:hypothetical protein